MKKNLAVCALVCAVMMVFAMNANAQVTITTREIQMNVLDLVVITGQPVGYDLYETEDLALTVTAIDATDYQWRKGGVPIDGLVNPSALTANLTIANALAADSGSYDCVVSNFLGPITSNLAVVIVYVRPTLTFTVVPPDDLGDPLGILNIATGANAVYSVTVTPAGTDPDPSVVTIQWQKDGADIVLDAHIVISDNILPGDTLTFIGLVNDISPLGDDGRYTPVVTCTAP